MPLKKIGFAPGFNKQATATEAERSVDRWRLTYVLGMECLKRLVVGNKYKTNTLVGAARAQHSWVDLDGRKYAAIGTNRLLVIYYDNTFYDVTPIDPDRQSTGANITTTNGSNAHRYNYNYRSSRNRSRRFNHI
jgi:hypothetical protein